VDSQGGSAVGGKLNVVKGIMRHYAVFESNVSREEGKRTVRSY
jgi:hypothetical protein